MVGGREYTAKRTFAQRIERVHHQLNDTVAEHCARMENRNRLATVLADGLTSHAHRRRHARRQGSAAVLENGDLCD